MTSTSNKEIVVANDIVKMAKNLSVKNSKQATYATEFLSRANQALDLLLEKEDERTQRLAEELAYIKAPYTEPKKALKAIIADLRAKLGAYQTENAQLAAAKADVIAFKADKELITPEMAVQQLDKIDTPALKIQGDTGSLTFRPKQTLKITNDSLIPRKYLLPDEDALLDDLKAGKKIPGCEIVIIQVPFNRRK